MFKESVRYFNIIVSNIFLDRISFQALNELRLGIELQVQASSLKRSAIQKMQIAFAGTNYEQFANLLAIAFGDEGLKTATDVAPGPAPPAEKRPKLELTELENEERSLVTSCEDIRDPDDVEGTDGFYPSSSKTKNDTGIPPFFQAKVSKPFGQKGPRSYTCSIGMCKGRSANRVRVHTHIRRHLGVSMACPYCPDYKTFATESWMRHMLATHGDAPLYVPSDSPYGVRAADVNYAPFTPELDVAPDASGDGPSTTAGASGDH